MKLSRATLVLTAASALVWTMAPPSSAEVADSPGLLAQSYTYSPFYGYVPFYGTWVEYQVDSAGQFPRVGDTFYVSTVVSALYGTQAPVMGLALHESLETDARLAITAQTPVRCYLKPALDSPTWQEVPESCSQDGMPNPNGGLTFGTRPLNYGESFKVSVPLVVNKTKSGIGDGDAARIFSIVSDINQTPDPLRADQHIFVFPAAPADTPGTNPGGNIPGANPGGNPPSNGGLQVGRKMKLPKRQSFGKAVYKSKTKKICTVSKKRVVKAKAAGTCKIKAKAKRGKGKKIIRITIR